jgi:riboflavin synthase alpha subunit
VSDISEHLTLTSQDHAAAVAAAFRRAIDLAAEYLCATSPTLTRTKLANLTQGAHVNLERSVRLVSRLSGHLVQGHINGKALPTSVVPEGGAHSSC